MVTITKAEYDEYLGLKSQVAYFQHQLSELRRMIFGVKSERNIAPNPEQTTLFEMLAEQPAEPETETITYTRNKTQKIKKQPLRLVLPSHLERRVEIIEPENLPANANCSTAHSAHSKRKCWSKHDCTSSG